jgi:DNA polymerase-1
MSKWWDRIRDTGCKECPLHEVTKRVCSVTGKGHVFSKVMFVGEAPGEQEERRGLPFVGPSGRIMLELLQDAHWDLPYSVTNAVCCRPPKNKTPTTKHWRPCRELFLLKTIDHGAPDMIVCWGKTAAQTVLNDSTLSVKRARRRVGIVERTVRHKKNRYQTRRKKIKVVTTYHPAAVKRNPALRSVVLEDLRWADRVYILQADGEDLGYAGRKSPIFSLDLETTGFDPWAVDARILTAARSSTPLHAFAWSIGDNAATRRLSRKLLRRNTLVIGHNIKFDLLWLKKAGFDIRCKVFDTLAAFHLMAEEYPDKGLEHLASVFTPMGRYAGGMKEERGHFDAVTEELLDYNAKDADATYRLYRLFRNRLRVDKLRRPFRLMMNTLRTLLDIEMAGMYVDQQELDLQSEVQRKKRRKLRRKLIKEFPGLNPRSPQQVAKLLFVTLGFKPTKFTQTDQASTNEEVLNKLLGVPGMKREKKVVRRILKLRELNTIESRYLGPLRDKHVANDGCAHPTYKLTGTVTGRLSCANPNLQNVPRGEGGLRSVFSSRWEGGSIIQADFSQAELRILAPYSEEPRMVKVFRRGGDIHTATASVLFRKIPKEVTKEERYLAKTINFGVIYGMTARRLMMEVNKSGLGSLTLEQADAFLEKYWAKYPKLDRWIRKTRREAIMKGKLRSMFGRVRHLGEIEDPRSKEGQHTLRQAVNFPIQSAASDITLICMNELHPYLNAYAMLIGTVHDSVIIDCPERELEETLMLVDEVLDPRNVAGYLKKWKVELKVPMKVDIEYGPDWGHLKKVA